MRQYVRRFAAAGLLAVLLSRFVAADEPPNTPGGDRMAAIIAAVRAEEAKYKDIEYVARIVVRDTRRQDPAPAAGDAAVTTMATRRVVLEGDRIFFRHQAFERMHANKLRREQISAYDGERTRTVVADNCVNIHLGRWEHPDIGPAHSVPLAHCEVNFPLSVYLGGTEAIDAHPRYPHQFAEAGRAAAFLKVAAHFEGEEEVDGLRCLKVRVDQSHANDPQPALQYLWLAPERNYHCIRGLFYRLGGTLDDILAQEMRVHELRELAPGRWFPWRIAVVEYDTQAQVHGPRPVVGRTETDFEKVDLAPRYPAAFYRDVAIPADLPVFTHKDRRLAGLTPPEPVVGDRERARMAEVVARVAEQEERYGELAVTARVQMKQFLENIFATNVLTESSSVERSILRGDRAYFTSQSVFTSQDGSQTERREVQAIDGDWKRTVWSQFAPDSGAGATLRKWRTSKGRGPRDGLPVYRPHMPGLRDHRIMGSLAELLVSREDDVRPAANAFRFRYCGEAEVDGHPCVVLRGEMTSVRGGKPSGALILYLATDRNDIPIKLELYRMDVGDRLTPALLGRCGDFREIAPGIWYPFRVTELNILTGARQAQGWLVLNRRRDYTIESATLTPGAGDALFREVDAPADATVQVIDEDGQFVGQFQQADDGILSLSTARYLQLLSQAPARPAEQRARQKALDALIGKPAPEFPPTASWLNGPPMSWQALRGRVVALNFWAEWNDAGRDDLVRLNRLHQDRAKSGLTIIGVHPPGSEPGAIKKVTDAIRLEYPVCVDIPPGEGVKGWGDFFGRFAVRALPHAAAIDAEGKVVACGRLEDVLAKAGELVKKVRRGRAVTQAPRSGGEAGTRTDRRTARVRVVSTGRRR